MGDGQRHGLFRRRERVGGVVDWPPGPWDDDPEPEYVPGVHELTVLSEGITLVAPIRFIRDSRLVLAGAAEPFPPGRLLMLGGPDWASFEIVQVVDASAASAASKASRASAASAVPQPAASCTVRRAQLGSVGVPHRPGTPVTPVSVESGRVLVLTEPEPGRTEPEPGRPD